MPKNKPNILLITSDQQHWNTLGCLNPEVKTPNLDRLAAEGTLFSRDEQELEQLLGRPVDLIERKSVERSENYIRRKSILESAEVIYAA